MNKAFLAFLFFSALFSPPDAAAQTAAELDRILSLSAVSFGDAAWFILNAEGTVLPAENSRDGAYRFAADKRWIPKKAAAEDPVTLGGVSFLITKAFSIKGGFMYTLFPGPRNAYRELVYRKIIQGRAYSTMPVSGERLLRILSRALEYAGDTAALAAEAAEAAYRQLQEDINASLNASAQEQEGVSAGSEEIIKYDDEFILD